MFRKDIDLEDLRSENFNLRKQNSVLHNENESLKQKLRKLHEEMIKRDKQLDAFLDPRKVLALNRIFRERGASLLLNLKSRNDKLEQIIIEKDLIIKRLEKALETAKLYAGRPMARKKSYMSRGTEYESKMVKLDIMIPQSKKSQRKYPSEETIRRRRRTESDEESSKGSSMVLMVEDLNERESKSDSRITVNKKKREQDADSDNEKRDNNKSNASLTAVSRANNVLDDLVSLAEEILANAEETSGNSGHSEHSASRTNLVTPLSDSERGELSVCDTPHEEIRQLHTDFKDMIGEIDSLKFTITQLKNDQEKTDEILKKKDENIARLADQIQVLREIKVDKRNDFSCQALFKVQRETKPSSKDASTSRPRHRSCSAKTKKRNKDDQLPSERSKSVAGIRASNIAEKLPCCGSNSQSRNKLSLSKSKMEPGFLSKVGYYNGINREVLSKILNNVHIINIESVDGYGKRNLDQELD